MVWVLEVGSCYIQWFSVNLSVPRHMLAVSEKVFQKHEVLVCVLKHSTASKIFCIKHVRAGGCDCWVVA